MKSLYSLLILLSLSTVFSCGKISKSPVDSYIESMDEATKKIEQISSMAELMNVESVISQEKMNSFISENPDYELSDQDKENLKESYDRLVRVSFEKTAEIGGLSENEKKQLMTQADRQIERVNMMIDEAKTFGEIK